jgi:hypothetical protein
MSVLFALPFDGRCLSPSPVRQPLPFEKGARVAWQDGEEGLVCAVTADALCIHWETGTWGWYQLHSIAATERITVLATRPESDWL